jgi:hypothetical protein
MTTAIICTGFTQGRLHGFRDIAFLLLVETRNQLKPEEREGSHTQNSFQTSHETAAVFIVVEVG